MISVWGKRTASYIVKCFHKLFILQETYFLLKTFQIYFQMFLGFNDSILVQQHVFEGMLAFIFSSISFSFFHFILSFFLNNDKRLMIQGM